jgi:hypothetical protein
LKLGRLKVAYREHLSAGAIDRDAVTFEHGTMSEITAASHRRSLLFLKHEIDNGEMLVITNPETLEEQECRVVYLGEPADKGQRVGVEFLTPAPRFWGVEFNDTPADHSSAAN